MTKRQYSEKSFRDFLDLEYPYGIHDDDHFYRSAKDLEKQDYSKFRLWYNSWLDDFERAGIDTGIYLK